MTNRKQYSASLKQLGLLNTPLESRPGPVALAQGDQPGSKIIRLDSEFGQFLKPGQ
jgi:hypothetical protein